DWIEIAEHNRFFDRTDCGAGGLCCRLNRSVRTGFVLQARLVSGSPGLSIAGQAPRKERCMRVRTLISTIVRGARQTCGLALVMSACAGTAAAFQPVVPEIDPGSASSALCLLAGGVLLLTQRARRT